MSNDYTNPNTNLKVLTTLNLTLSNPHDAFESLWAPVCCDFKTNYLGSELGPLVTLIFKTCEVIKSC